MIRISMFLAVLSIFAYEYCQGVMFTVSEKEEAFTVLSINKEKKFMVIQAPKPLPRKKEKLKYKIPLTVLPVDMRTNLKKNSKIKFEYEIQCNNDKKCEHFFKGVFLNGDKNKNAVHLFNEPFTGEIYVF